MHSTVHVPRAVRGPSLMENVLQDEVGAHPSYGIHLCEAKTRPMDFRWTLRLFFPLYQGSNVCLADTCYRIPRTSTVVTLTNLIFCFLSIGRTKPSLLETWR
jgi:hypothetical protein